MKAEGLGSLPFLISNTMAKIFREKLIYSSIEEEYSPNSLRANSMKNVEILEVNYFNYLFSNWAWYKKDLLS